MVFIVSWWQVSEGAKCSGIKEGMLCPNELRIGEMGGGRFAQTLHLVIVFLSVVSGHSRLLN